MRVMGRLFDAWTLGRVILAGLPALAHAGAVKVEPATAQEAQAAQRASLTDTISEAAFARLVNRGTELFNGGTCIKCHAVGGRALASYIWSLSHGRQTPLVAAQNEFLRLADRGDVVEARDVFEGWRREHSDSPFFDEPTVNTLGYEYLVRREPEVAVALLELNTELHPDSWNAWDSLAEAWAVTGDRTKAIELYEKSIELNPRNQNGKQKLAKLREAG